MRIKISYLFIFFVYLISALVYQFLVLKSYKSLPSPLYGGDYYYQMGAIIHIRDGGNPFESSSLRGGICGYLPLYSWLCAKFSDLFKLDTLKGEFYFSLFLFIISSFIWYSLGYLIFKDKFIGIIASLLGCNLIGFPILKYTVFSFYVTLPLFMLFFYRVYKNNTIRDFIFLGIVLGFTALSHTVLFMGSMVISHLYLFLKIARAFLKKELNIVRDLFFKWVLLLIFMLPLALLYWYKPIFIYHLKSVNDIIHWGSGNFQNPKYRYKFLFKVLKDFFVGSNFLIIRLLTLFSLGGIIFLFLRNKNSLGKFLYFFLTASFILTFSYFFTEPLLHINFLPYYCKYFFINISKILSALYFFHFLIKANLIKTSIFRFLIVLILCFSNIFSFFLLLRTPKKDNFWPPIGKKTLPSWWYSLREYIFENTSVEDVFISTKELSFALNGLTGRKVLTNRWVHQNDPYQNFSERDIAAALILYSSDDKTRLELIKKYKVKYLYWNWDWFNTQFHFNREGRIIGIFDPFMCIYSPERERLLKENGIYYIKVKYWVEPALRGESFPQYKLLMILPFIKGTDFYHPWHKNLNKYLKEVWSYSDENLGKIAVLYKILIE